MGVRLASLLNEISLALRPPWTRLSRPHILAVRCVADGVNEQMISHGVINRQNRNCKSPRSPTVVPTIVTVDIASASAPSPSPRVDKG